MTGTFSSGISAAPTRSEWIVLAAMLVTALALRIWLVSHNGFLSVDSVFYLDQTSRLLNQGTLPFSVFPPGWPLIVAVPFAFLDHADPGQLLKAAQSTNAVLGTLLPLLTYVLLRPRLGPVLALAGAVVVAFLPETMVLSKTALSELSYACCLLGAWLLARRQLGWQSGLLFAYAYLIRPEALLAAAGLGLHHIWHERRVPWSFGLAVLAGVVPYVIFLKMATGAWSLSGKTVAVSLSLQAYPGLSYLGLVVRNLGVFLPKLPGLVGWPLALLALAGTLARPGRWLWMLAPMLPIPFIINPMVVRFWAPYLPYLLLAAGLGAVWLDARIRDWQPGLNHRMRAAVLGGLTVAGLGVAVADDANWVVPNSESFHGLKEAGLWLRERVDQDTVVAAYKPYASFWAGCSFIKYPDEDRAENIIAFARNKGAEYMVVSVGVVHSLVPALDPLLGSPLPPHLAGKVTLLHLIRFDQVRHTTAIYRIEPAP